jgi:hypothetical protein
VTAANVGLTQGGLPESLPTRLPAWRLALGSFILGAMALVLLSLAPVYWKDWQLRNGLREFARQPAITSMQDGLIRTEVIREAYATGLPISAPDVQIHRQDGRVRVEVKYTVYFQSYQVDLHFHTTAVSR